MAFDEEVSKVLKQTAKNLKRRESVISSVLLLCCWRILAVL